MNALRSTPIEISENEFIRIGHNLINDIAQFNSTISERPVTQGKTPEDIQSLLGERNFPSNGESPSELISRTSEILFNNSLFNGHPKFMGYITASAAPIGALGDLLAATVNPNCGAFTLSPVATEIEKQTIQWLAEFIGVSSNYGGILVSGGNMANFTAFLAARTAKTPSNFKEDGFLSRSEKMMIYCSKTTHTWIEKAAILFGHGTKSVRWIETDDQNKMDLIALESAIKSDLEKGHKPFMVAGTAGDVSTGTIDDLQGIADICKNYDLWFHVDGAYGVPAAILPENKTLFNGLQEADSIAMDPHKWLYSPLEAGCTLVKNPKHLIDTYSSHPEYYNFSNANSEQNFYEYGLQNSRGFRALKVWLMLQQVGRKGYEEMIKEDIELAELMFQKAQNHPRLEAKIQNLSITTFRYIPESIPENIEDKNVYLNQLNETLVTRLQNGGKLFLSNAIINEQYCMRACIVNFRTSKKDIEEIIDIIVEEGAKINKALILTETVK
ncbi:MAG: aspartate aminotransferase family protein [Bacteroidetes bacterium]|nr:MAG: aspartate aminotransferase family protein [Bacteroidota bacterium]